MTEAQVAANYRALSNLAGRLERMGYTGDALMEAEHIALNLLADGYRRIEPPVPLRPERAASPAVQAAAMADIRTTLSTRRTGGTR